MTPEILKTIEAGKVTAAQGAALEKLQPGTYVLHKSWGFGQITAVDFLVNQMTIDFNTKRAHPMQLQYGADSLLPIAPDHILAQKAADISGVKARAKDDPVAFIQRVLRSYGGKSTQDQIAQALVPDVFTEAEWKRWWENTKKLLKKDGHFAIPSKKGEAIVLREAAVSRADEHLVAFSHARQLKDQLVALDQILKNLEEFTDPASQLQPIVVAAEDAARKNARLNTAAALQLLAARDEIAERSNGTVRASESMSVAAILREEERQLMTLLEQIPMARLRRILAELPAAFEDWVSRALVLVTRGNARVVGESARLLQDLGKTEDLRVGLDRALRDHSITSAALTWLCDKRERKGEFRELIHPRVLSAILSALERDQFNENRDRKLHDLLMNDKELLPDLVAEASGEELREVMRKLLVTPVFEELNKRSLLGRIVRIHPEMQSMITSDSEERQEALVVSWSSLERRKLEYEDLVKKKIPENTKEIAVARSHGDLRENFEYKAAKDMQLVLMRRQADTERELALARGTDYSNADLTQVSIGTIVTVKDVATGATEVYTILGAWDGDPEKGIISYQTAIGQALLAHKIGEKVPMPTEHGERMVQIMSIEAWRNSVLQ